MATRAIGVHLPWHPALEGRRLTTPDLIAAAVVALIALRAASAALLPVSFDESYFWLWSKNLAWSYYDHPPMIALAIGSGTALFGDTTFGIRFISFLASLVASAAVWRAGTLLLKNAQSGALACLLFNVTLMVAVETMAATPDALVIAASAGLLWAVARLEQSHDARWWLAIGTIVGFALLCKYTGFFLFFGIGLWLLATPQGRGWLRTPWPFAGAVLALAALVPNILWNAAHDWISFKFQFGRVVTGAATFRYLFEFLGSQTALASPFLLVLAVTGLVHASHPAGRAQRLAFAAALIWPALVYFCLHALHDRVQGNWPSFIYPALAIFAASEFDPRRNASWLRFSRMAALPTAFFMLGLVYVQAASPLLALGISDPVARTTAISIEPVVRDIAELAKKSGAKAIVTAKYGVTGWMRFYLPSTLRIIQINQDERWLSSKRAPLALLNSPLLFVTQHPDKELEAAREHFHSVRPLEELTRSRGGKTIDSFWVYTLSGYHGKPAGRMP